MTYDDDLYGEFGSGYEWKSGAYPTPPDPVRHRLEEKPRENFSLRQTPPDTSRDRSSQDPRPAVEQFQGVLLSVIPPHTISVDGEEDGIQVGTLFLGNGREWVRVSFWGESAEQVEEYRDADSDTTVEVRGWTDEEREITDFHLFNDDRTSISRIDKQITYTPDPIDSGSIEEDSLVEMVVGDVLFFVSDTHIDAEEEQFDVQHLTLDINDDKFVVELHDSHVDQQVGLGDTIYVFAGWGKNKDRFIHDDLLYLDYEGKFWVRHYSGFRNVSRNPLPE